MHSTHKKLWLILALFSWYFAHAQDIHYSQFYYNHQGLNPALVGHYLGSHRITALYRNQWQSVPVPYLSFGLFYDTQFRLSKIGDGIGFGIGFDYDRAGDSRLSLSAINAHVNYGLTIGKHLISFGVSPNFGQRHLSEQKLRWKNQWNGDRYDPKLSPKEAFVASGNLYFDLAAGISYQFAMTKRTRFQAGSAVFHLMKPNQTFYTNNNQSASVELPFRHVYQAMLSLGLLSHLDIVLRGMHQTQSKYKETVASGLFNIYLNKRPGALLNMIAGCNYRLDDAIIPTLAFQYNEWMVSAAYDITVSNFRNVTNRRGGPEFALQYLFKNIEPVGVYKKCPIY